MRKIEQIIIDNLMTSRANGPLKLSKRDAINYYGAWTEYKLYATTLAGIHESIDGSKILTIFSGGYRTRTTKNRLDAILSTLAGARLYQKKYVWYVSMFGGEKEYHDGMQFNI